MRVLLLNQVFFPDVAATAQHAHDLARHLVAHGHDVVVIASRSIYGQRGAALPRRESVDGIEIHRVGRSLFGKAGIPTRLLDFALFYLAATIKAFAVRRPDVVVCFTTPPLIALVGPLMRLLRGSKFVYWVMDLYPDVAVAGGLIKPTSVLTRLLERLNRFCLRTADRTVVLGRCMMQRVRDKGVDHGQIVHIGVWADHREVNPLPRRRNPYRDEWDLGDRTVVMYCGNFGLANEMETMCEAAARLSDDDRVQFVFVGGGKRKLDVERFLRDRNVRGRVEPYQSRERLGTLLSCADVHVVTLKEAFEGLVVPCKLFGALAAGRPVIFVGPRGSEIGRVIQESNAGYVVRPGDVDGMVRAVRELAGHPGIRRRLGCNARQALLERYDRALGCDAWQQLLEEVASVEKGAPVPEPDPVAIGNRAQDG